MTPRRERALDAFVLMVAKVAVGAWVLRQGFTHVSDDDYARTVIAEQFAHAPRLDPSGTSWLPAPFWLEGGVMMVGGRTLGVARAVAVVLGALAVVAPYLAMRAVGVRRLAAIVATLVAMALPWNAWLGVATVPEGWFGAVVAGSVVALGSERARAAHGVAAMGLLLASLSRYEAWPACAVLGGLCAWRAFRGAGTERRRQLACLMTVAAGPIAWMMWNAHAHGSALHFVARVTTFRQAIGAADVPFADKLLAYPRALLLETPEVALLGAVGIAGLLSAPLRARWSVAGLAVLAVLVFLIWGDVHDGAPTHHPARALTATWWVLVGMGVDAVTTLASQRSANRRRVVTATAGLAGLAWCAWLPGRWADAPGRAEAERRESQIARGLDLRARGDEEVEVTPCAFEHFALLAAWGAPERATVLPRTGAPVTPECPRVAEH